MELGGIEMNEYVAQTPKAGARQLGWSLRQERRAVEVTLTYHGVETEPFEVSDPVFFAKILRKYEDLDLTEKLVYKFTGIKQESLPFGLRRTRQTVTLPNSEVAIRYLKRCIDLPAA